MELMYRAAESGAEGNHLLIGNMIVTIVVFLLLLVLLKKFAWGPLINMMKAREEHVASEINAAEKSRKDAEVYVEQQQTELSKARTEARDLLESARRQSEAEQARAMEQARVEAEMSKEEARREIERERAEAQAALKDEVALQAIAAARHVMKTQLASDEAAQKALVQQFLADTKGSN
ncbi:F0F1 ATP synthase subunit B [Exiguobacterium flavidum]|uniref:F0F1 ATP synthase subunit B n=1 Tax=Exiguobacterium flavidum TaxID=2184695 RepID=UPI000DF7C3CC|nr:F0F1 ATP synthase subunit B [Exiguobacterium flavidum]